MKGITIAVIALAVVAISGCATKHYGRAPVVTENEVAQLNCKELNVEIAQTHGFIEQVEQESQFDGRSVLSFLGDFGIGNVMEKEAAMKSANQRLSDLETARHQKDCGTSNVAQS